MFAYHSSIYPFHPSRFVQSFILLDSCHAAKQQTAERRLKAHMKKRRDERNEDSKLGYICTVTLPNLT